VTSLERRSNQAPFDGLAATEMHMDRRTCRHVEVSITVLDLRQFAKFEGMFAALSIVLQKSVLQKMSNL
jgi:hypothetical protein